MNEELTREAIKAIVKCGGAEYSKCENCPATKICDYTDGNICKRLATALLEELDKPKVWDGAPEWAKIGRVYWTDGYEREKYSKLYNRELPKTRTRQIAEEVVALVNRAIEGISVVEIESVLNKYAKELEGKK